MKKGGLSVRHLLGIESLTSTDIELIFQTADEFLQVLGRPIKKVPALREVTVANVFFENSTRTRISFELAEKRLSCDVINFSASGSSVAKGETLIDTVRNIEAMKTDVIVLRHASVGAPHLLVKHCKSIVINAGDGTHEHPTQGLLDAFSLKQKFGTLRGLKVAIVGDILHSRVALSNVFCLQKLGALVCVCGPPTLIPKYFYSLGVQVNYDFDQVLAWCDAVNMLRIQQERMQTSYFPSEREYISLYQLNSERLNRLAAKEKMKDIVILHPGPINRGVEITSEIADSKQAIILEQVLSGVAIRMAVLYLLAG
jgi:aspartate carbamoyltransferase catalytic subunit